MNKETLLKLSQKVSELFTSNDVKWRFGEELRNPTVEEISDAIDSMAQTLYAKDDDWSQVIMGQLLIVKDNDFIDVYVRIGELNVLEES